jgi:5-methylcytosine-specific restriction endonuclease McrA
MSLIHKPVLMINATYEPLDITSAKKALKKIVKQIAVIEEERDGLEIYPGIAMPSVVRLLEYRRVPQHLTRRTRKNFYLRDRYCCQYCGGHFAAADLTLDHVIPKSRGGPDSWENLVTCCKTCNREKENKLPAEAGMQLLHKPAPLTVHTSKYIMRQLGLEEDARWAKYLYA